MDGNRLILIGMFFLLIVIFVLGRWLYIRSMRIRNRMQMNYIFTNITHELLTPLTILAASVEQLRSHASGSQQEYDLMDLNIQRTVRLLQQILETSKSQAGELKLLVSNGDVMQYITQTARCIQPLMNSKNLDFSIHCKPESMIGWIDTDKLDKIIFNLLSNAVKYTGENGKVTLDVATNPHYDHIVIRVSDNGSGIAKEQMKHLFSRFHDGDYRSKQTFGTGIGLSLTRDLVYLHGGTIRCQSMEGQGTTFIVELPINKEAFAASQIDEKNKININVPQSAILDLPPQPDTKRMFPTDNASPTLDDDAYRLLIVEDNNELLMLMKQLMQQKYRVFTANNGREALDVVHSQPLDLIVSDVMMPEMDGYQLTTAVKQDPSYSHLPIILLTAKTQDEDRMEALTTGADDYITKPFKLGELQLRIDNIMANRLRIHHDYHQEEADEVASYATDRLTPLDREFLQRVIQCINDHMTDSDYDRNALATDMGASGSTLYKKLQALTGMNFTEFIRDIRIKEACRIAKDEPDLRVSDIAYRVGFNPKYFATTFKKEMGLQPKEYFERLRSGEDPSTIVPQT